MDYSISDQKIEDIQKLITTIRKLIKEGRLKEAHDKLMKIYDITLNLRPI